MESYIYNILNYMSPYVRRAWDGKLPTNWHLDERMIFDFEIVYIMEGSVAVKIQDQEYTGVPGDIFFFRPLKRHSMQAVGDIPLRQPHVHFDFFYQDDSEKVYVPVWPLSELGEDIKYLRSDITGTGFLNIPDKITLKNPAKLEELLFKVIKQEENSAPFSILLKKSHLLELIAFILTEAETKYSDDVDSGLSLVNIERLELARKYISENINKSLTLNEISLIAGFSKNYFARIFKVQYGVNPMQFHTDLRIERAKQLLTFSEMNVTEIAIELGYMNIHTFSRAFRKSTAMSPTSFRNEISRTQ